MLIRSQDKKWLINLDNIELVSIHGYRVDSKRVYEDEENANTWYVTFVAQDNSPFVGHYSTEAKAIKVLDMIENAWENQTEKFRHVFSMPSDEEVEA